MTDTDDALARVEADCNDGRQLGRMMVTRRDDIRAMTAELRRLQAQTADLNKKVYQPGVFKCPKCNFQLVQKTLNAHSGNVTSRDDVGEKCPNDGSPMWRVSYQEDNAEAWKWGEAQFDRVQAAEAQLADERMEHNLLKEMLSRPQVDEFLDGVVSEAAHQRQRWGDAHDRDKSAESWYWLVGYLSGKAVRSAIEGDRDKARHHTISSAAVLFQWWKAIHASANGVGGDTDLDPVARAHNPANGGGEG